MIIGIIVGSIELAILLLTELKKNNGWYFKLIYYLYYKFGILLINRKDNLDKFSNIKGKNISDVLFIGVRGCNQIINEICRRNTVLRAGKCWHCSSKNISVKNTEYIKTWLLHDDSAIISLGHVIQKTSFNNFLVDL